MSITNFYLMVKSGEDTTSHDNLKKVYICADIIDNGNINSVRISNTMNPEGTIMLACMPTSSDMQKIKKSTDNKYYVMNSIYSLLREVVPDSNFPNFKEYGVQIR